MTTYTALTTLAGRETAEALGEALEELDSAPMGVGVFEIEDDSGVWEVQGYFDGPPDEVGLALLSAAYGAAEFAVSEVPDTDWVDKVRRELTPVQAGRFFVYGSHDADKVPAGAEPLLIEAAMAFGTGHHGTTLGCLRALDRLAEDGVVGRNVADIGCGTAVLAMAAARIWPNPVLASDIDAVAVEVAEANVRANGLEGRVICLEAEGLDAPRLADAAPFDLVFANILMAPLIALAPEMGQAIAPGGHAILSGILTRQADETFTAYEAAGFAVAHRDVIGDWVTLTLRRS